MRGNVNIINSEADFKGSSMTAAQAIAAATITVRHDAAVYPSDYDQNLKEGESGYIAPEYIFKQVVDQAVLTRFGVDSE